jgi:hypothetical protein
MLALQLSFIDANQFLSFAGFLTKTIVGNAIEPGRKPGLPTEATEVLVSTHKCLLRKIVCEGDICANQLAKQTSNTRLMISHQLRKSVVVVIEKNASNEVGIG